MTDEYQGFAERAIERTLRAAREARERMTAGLHDSERRRLEKYLADGGRVERIDHGGAVGVVWHSITRNERAWCGTVGDELRDADGFARRGKVYDVSACDGRMSASERPEHGVLARR